MRTLVASQQRVAACTARRVLVLAGAGTGKTTTCVAWAARRIAEGVNPDRLLLITFTRRAASEMRHRIAEETKAKVSTHTFHSFATAVLRSHPQVFGGERFTILDEEDSKLLYRRAARSLNLGKEFPAAHFSAIISRERNFMRPIGSSGSGSVEQMVTVKLHRAYSLLKEQSNVLDYDDLLERLLGGLRTHRPFAAAIRARFSHVLVDEVQDNNPLNYEILRAMNPAHLVCVGDRCQSIYGFRAADPSLLDRFREDNPDVKVFRLEDNFRSGRRILSLANHLTAEMPDGLTLSSALQTPAALHLIRPADPQHEAALAAEDIARLLVRGVQAGDISVLCRTSRGTTALEGALSMRGVALRKYGGQSLADSGEIRDLTAVLRAALNPQDRPALERVLRMYPGVGAVVAERSAAKMKPAAEAARAAFDLVSLVRPRLNDPSLLGELPGLLAPLLHKNYDDPSARLINVTQVCHSFQGAQPAKLLDAFATDALKMVGPSGDAVSVSTIHSAKGLEWKHVWIIGAGDLQIPHPRSRSPRAIDEERRLLYVAVTRAKERLVLSAPVILPDRGTQSPTRFIAEDVQWQRVAA
ncbi:MAG: ATP-dependent helicase, partial [Rhizobium sp.]